MWLIGNDPNWDERKTAGRNRRPGGATGFGSAACRRPGFLAGITASRKARVTARVDPRLTQYHHGRSYETMDVRTRREMSQLPPSTLPGFVVQNVTVTFLSDSAGKGLGPLA